MRILSSLFPLGAVFVRSPPLPSSSDQDEEDLLVGSSSLAFSTDRDDKDSVLAVFFRSRFRSGPSPLVFRVLVRSRVFGCAKWESRVLDQKIRTPLCCFCRFGSCRFEWKLLFGNFRVWRQDRPIWKFPDRAGRSPYLEIFGYGRKVAPSGNAVIFFRKVARFRALRPFRNYLLKEKYQRAGKSGKFRISALRAELLKMFLS